MSGCVCLARIGAVGVASSGFISADRSAATAAATTTIAAAVGVCWIWQGEVGGLCMSVYQRLRSCPRCLVVCRPRRILLPLTLRALRAPRKTLLLARRKPRCPRTKTPLWATCGRLPLAAAEQTVQRRALRSCPPVSALLRVLVLALARVLLARTVAVLPCLRTRSGGCNVTWPQPMQRQQRPPHCQPRARANPRLIRHRTTSNRVAVQVGTAQCARTPVHSSRMLLLSLCRSTRAPAAVVPGAVRLHLVRPPL